MTDERARDCLIIAIRRLPPRSAVVVRPGALAPTGRAALIRHIRRVARARRHLVLIAAPHDVAGYDGWFGQPRRLAARGILAMPVHNRREADTAMRAGATVSLVSPLFATRSHPGMPTLGMRGFARLARTAGMTTIALGGMDAERFVAARRHGASGWAAIDAWIDSSN